MIKGLDCSKWNGQGTWQTVKEAGVSFVIIRAGSVDSFTGKPYTDSLLVSHLIGAQSVNIPYGFYWYFRPKHSAQAQADAFALLAIGQEAQLPMVIDVEEPGISPEQTRFAVLEMGDRLRVHGFNKLAIYTRQSFWDYNVMPSTRWKEFDLWPARWSTALTSPWSDGRFKFRDWDNWLFWQCWADGNAQAMKYGFPGYPTGDNDLDLNWFNGTQEEFNARFNVTAPLTVEERLDRLEERVDILERSEVYID